MTFPFARLFRTLIRLDQSGDGPPWPADVWNADTATWEPIGIVGAQGPTAPTFSVVTDTFTLTEGEVADEDLTAHLGQLGGPWSKVADSTAGAQLLVGGPGRAYLGGTLSGSGYVYWWAHYRPSARPPSADYIVEADVLLVTVPPGPWWEVALHGRESAAGDCYILKMAGYDAPNWLLSKQVGGTQTILASSAASFTAGQLYTMTLVMQGDQISGQVDGTTVVGPVADSTLAAAEDVGVGIYSETESNGGFTPGPDAGPQLDSIRVALLLGAPLPGPPSGWMTLTLDGTPRQVPYW